MNQQKRWEILNKPKKKNLKIKEEEIIPLLLKNRGIKSEKERKEFFNPTSPSKMSLKELGINKLQVERGIKRIKKALKEKEKVIVYGDYDADGICATAILWETLFNLGLDVLPYIPERFSEGYGLNKETIAKLKKDEPSLKLIITVDHGIVAGEKITFAQKLGLDVIVTDHHVPEKKIKPYALIHTTKISGSAVAWIFGREILKGFKKQRNKISSEETLDLAAIGTIADQLPLIGPNRSIVKFGLEKLNETKRVGLLALFEEAALKKGTLGPYEVGFMIAPRLNAMGRLVHAVDSLRLLCTKNKERALQLASLIGKTNLERQKIVGEVVGHARKSYQGKVGEIILLAHESYHEGVIGLAAAKLVEEFYLPAIVLSKKKGISKASARSISGFNIIETIRKLEGFYLEGGGHPMAAGFSIETAKIETFRKKINEISAPLLTPEILTPKIKIDLEVSFDNLNQKLFDLIASFEPTGLGNPAPTFMTQKVNILEAKTVGAEGKHLVMKLENEGNTFETIAFGFGNYLKELTPQTKINIVYLLEEDSWNGYKKLRLRIKDLKVSS
jgi:single-stranded-DNA-specific exonuclease